MNIIGNIYNKSKATIYVAYDKFNSTLKTNDLSLNNDVSRVGGNNSYSSHIETIISSPSLIIDNIYLGSSFNAANYNELINNKISVIINVTKDISNFYEKEKNIEYYKIPIYDINDESIIDYLENVYNFILKNKNKNILIHCFAGRSRSAAVVLFYLIKKYDFSIDTAYDYLVSKRSLVNMNTSFYDEIKNYFNKK